MKDKYTLDLDDYLIVDGIKVYRITSTRASNPVGGYIDDERALSHKGDCWVSGNACVYGGSKVTGDVLIEGLAKVKNSQCSGKAVIGGNAVVVDSEISGEAIIGDRVTVTNSIVNGRSSIRGKAEIRNALITDGMSIGGNATVTGGRV